MKSDRSLTLLSSRGTLLSLSGLFLSLTLFLAPCRTHSDGDQILLDFPRMSWVLTSELNHRSTLIHPAIHISNLTPAAIIFTFVAANCSCNSIMYRDCKVARGDSILIPAHSRVKLSLSLPPGTPPGTKGVSLAFHARSQDSSSFLKANFEVNMIVDIIPDLAARPSIVNLPIGSGLSRVAQAIDVVHARRSSTPSGVFGSIEPDFPIRITRIVPPLSADLTTDLVQETWRFTVEALDNIQSDLNSSLTFSCPQLPRSCSTRVPVSIRRISPIIAPTLVSMSRTSGASTTFVLKSRAEVPYSILGFKFDGRGSLKADARPVGLSAEHRVSLALDSDHSQGVGKLTVLVNHPAVSSIVIPVYFGTPVKNWRSTK